MFYFYGYLTIIICLSRKHKSVCGLSKPDSTTWDQSGKRLHNITVGCGHERNFHDFGPGEMMKWWTAALSVTMLFNLILRSTTRRGRGTFLPSSGKRILSDTMRYARQSAAPAYRISTLLKPTLLTTTDDWWMVTCGLITDMIVLITSKVITDIRAHFRKYIDNNDELLFQFTTRLKIVFYVSSDNNNYCIVTLFFSPFIREQYSNNYCGISLLQHYATEKPNRCLQ